MMRAVCILVALILPATLRAWEPVKSTIHPKYPVLDVRTTSVVKDHRGLVWIGESNGLMYTDGSTIGPLYKTSAPLTTVAVVDTLLWAGMANGRVAVFDPVAKRWITEFPVADSVEIGAIRGYRSGVLIGTAGRGLVRITAQDTLHIDSHSGLRDDVVHDVVAFQNDVVVGTDRGPAVWHLDRQDAESVGPTYVTTAMAVEDSTLWVGTVKSGIHRFDGSTGSHTLVAETKDPVRKIVPYRSGLVVATSQGVFYHADQRAESDVATTLFTGPVSDFVRTDDGMLIILTPTGRLVSIDLRFAQLPARGIAGKITALAHRDGLLFVADSLGVFVTSAARPSFTDRTELPGHPVVVSMLPSAQGVYVGTFNEGIFHVDDQGVITDVITEHDGLPDNNVLSLAHYHDTLWIATLSGLSIYTPGGAVRDIRDRTPFGNTYIYAVHGAADGLYVGTDGRGAFRYRDGHFGKLPLHGEDASGTVYQFAEDGTGNVWINFKDKEPLRYNPREERMFATEDFPLDEGYYMLGGLDSTAALAIGDGWFCVIDPSRGTVTDRTRKFPELSGEYLGNLARDSRGRVYFATGRHLYRYDPDRHRRSIPKLITTGFQVNLKEVLPNQRRFDTDQNHLVVSWIALWYANPENVALRYRLGGREEAWSYTRSRQLVYPSLSPGDYTLEMQAGVEGVFYPVGGLVHSFSIARPLYTRAWFLALVLLGFILLTYIGVRRREARLHRIKTEKLRAVETELTLLRNQVNPHFLFNSFNTLMNIIETRPDAAGHYLQHLSDYYRKILTKRQYAAISVREELKGLREYFYLQKYRFGEALELRVSIAEEALDTPMPAMTLQLLAENAVKHNVVTRRAPLTVSVYTTATHLVMENPRRPKKQAAAGAGIGLENIRSRYRVMYDRDIEIRVDDEQFTVRLPLIYG